MIDALTVGFIAIAVALIWRFSSFVSGFIALILFTLLLPVIKIAITHVYNLLAFGRFPYWFPPTQL